MLRRLRDKNSGELIRPGDPIPTRRLAAETVGLLRRSWGAAWPAWLAAPVALVVVYALAAAMFGPQRALQDWEYLALTAADAATISIPFGFALRIALGAARPLAWDAGLGWSTAVSVFGALTLSLVNLLGAAITPDRIIDLTLQLGMDPMRDIGVAVGLRLGYLIVCLSLAVGLVMLNLWPVALLIRDPGASPRKSWRDMRGALFPMLAALVVGTSLSGAAYLALDASLPAGALGDEMSLLSQFVGSLGLLPTNLAITAAYGAIWRIRSGDAARRITAFD